MEKNFWIFLSLLLVVLVLPVINSGASQIGELRVTTEHPFLVGGEWVGASELEVGNELTTVDGKLARITSIERVVDDVEVFNIEDDEGINNYVVGDYDVVVHNSNVKKIDPSRSVSANRFGFLETRPPIVKKTSTGFVKSKPLKSQRIEDPKVIAWFYGKEFRKQLDALVDSRKLLFAEGAFGEVWITVGRYSDLSAYPKEIQIIMDQVGIIDESFVIKISKKRFLPQLLRKSGLGNAYDLEGEVLLRRLIDRGIVDANAGIGLFPEVYAYSAPPLCLNEPVGGVMISEKLSEMTYDEMFEFLKQNIRSQRAQKIIRFIGDKLPERQREISEAFRGVRIPQKTMMDFKIPLDKEGIRFVDVSGDNLLFEIKHPSGDVYTIEEVYDLVMPLEDLEYCELGARLYEGGTMRPATLALPVEKGGAGIYWGEYTVEGTGSRSFGRLLEQLPRQ